MPTLSLYCRQHGRLDPLKDKLTCAHLRDNGKVQLLCCAGYECKLHGDRRGYCAPKVLRRAQLLKRSLGLSFVCNNNRVGADYGKRVPQPRDASWEQQHGAVRVTTVPHGYQGTVW